MVIAVDWDVKLKIKPNNVNLVKIYPPFSVDFKQKFTDN